jgi:hypothetical protein
VAFLAAGFAGFGSSGINSSPGSAAGRSDDELAGTGCFASAAVAGLASAAAVSAPVLAGGFSAGTGEVWAGTVATPGAVVSAGSSGRAWAGAFRDWAGVDLAGRPVDFVARPAAGIVAFAGRGAPSRDCDCWRGWSLGFG